MNNENKVPSDRFIDSSIHTWLKPNLEKSEITIGLDEVAIKNIGDLVYLSYNEIKEVSKGDILGKLEAAKMVDNIISPLSGKIIQINENVIKNPALVNDDPYGEGWLFKISPSNWEAEKELFIQPENADNWITAELEAIQE